jgi:hypothetical protein
MEMHDLFSLDYRSRRTTHPYGAYVVTVIEQRTRRSDGIFRRYRPHFSVHIELFIFNDPLHKTMITQNCNIQQFGIYTQIQAPLTRLETFFALFCHRGLMRHRNRNLSILDSVKVIEMIPSKSGMVMSCYPAEAIAQAWLNENSQQPRGLSAA